jgi:hypothetical protein
MWVYTHYYEKLDFDRLGQNLRAAFSLSHRLISRLASLIDYRNSEGRGDVIDRRPGEGRTAEPGARPEYLRVERATGPRFRLNCSMAEGGGRARQPGRAVPAASSWSG